MALKFERRHLTYRTWFHKRPSGRAQGEAAPGCCLLLLSDTGAETDEFLLLTDDGCLELLGCDNPPTDDCMLLLSDTGTLTDELLLLTDDGCLELLTG